MNIPSVNAIRMVGNSEFQILLILSEIREISMLSDTEVPDKTEED